MTTDDELMAKVARGDSTAFNELFKRHSGKALGYATRLLGGDSVLAEDVSQTVWCKVVQAAPQYEGKGQFVAWLFTIVRNSTFSLKRKTDEEVLDTETNESASEDPSAETVLIETQDTGMLRKCIDQLPQSQREVLVMWMAEDLSYQELAAQFRTTESTIKSLLFRARTSLAKSLPRLKRGAK